MVDLKSNSWLNYLKGDQNYPTSRGSRSGVSCNVFKNFAKYTGKHLCWSLFLEQKYGFYKVQLTLDDHYWFNPFCQTLSCHPARSKNILLVISYKETKQLSLAMRINKLLSKCEETVKTFLGALQLSVKNFEPRLSCWWNKSLKLNHFWSILPFYTSWKHRNSCPEVFCKKGVLRNFVKFTGKHLRRRLFFNKGDFLWILRSF